MIMEKMTTGFNIRPYCFSVFLLIFAIQPVTESNDVIFYTLSAVMGLSILIMLVSGIISLSKNKRGFIKSAVTPNTPFQFFYILTAVVGIVVAYSLNSNAYKGWIFMLILFMIPVLIPSPEIDKTS
jgi:hypothetical protein